METIAEVLVDKVVGHFFNGLLWCEFDPFVWGDNLSEVETSRWLKILYFARREVVWKSFESVGSYWRDGGCDDFGDCSSAEISLVEASEEHLRVGCVCFMNSRHYVLIG